MSLVTELFTGLIGIHAVRHSGGIPGIYFFQKVNSEIKLVDAKIGIQKISIMQIIL